jgi:hypothetical protein
MSMSKERQLHVSKDPLLYITQLYSGKLDPHFFTLNKRKQPIRTQKIDYISLCRFPIKDLDLVSHLTAPDLAHWRRHCNAWTVNQCRLFRCGLIVSFVALKIRSFSLLMAAIESTVREDSGIVWLRDIHGRTVALNLKGIHIGWDSFGAEGIQIDDTVVISNSRSNLGTGRLKIFHNARYAGIGSYCTLKSIYAYTLIMYLYLSYVPTEYPLWAPHYLSKPE